MAKSENGVTTTYVVAVLGLSQVLVETTGGQTARYVYGHDLLAEQDTTWAWHLNDGLGSVRQLVDEDGQVTLAQGYTPFGVPLWSEGSGATGYGFTGERGDASAGLIFLRGRYYDPVIGRFISKDPWSGDIGEPQTQNGYSYVKNNPINLVDPSGHQDITEWLEELWENIQEWWDDVEGWFQDDSQSLEECWQSIQEWWAEFTLGWGDVLWQYKPPQTIGQPMLLDPQTVEQIRRMNEGVEDVQELATLLRMLEYSGPPEGWPNRFQGEQFPEDAPLGEELQDVLSRGDFISEDGFGYLEWWLLPPGPKKDHLRELMDQYGQCPDGRYDFTKYNYVIDTKGKIRVGRHGHHSDVSKGQNVYGAGEIFIDRKGNILRIDDQSGHYLPRGVQFEGFMKNLLEDMGIKLPNDVFRFGGK